MEEMAIKKDSLPATGTTTEDFDIKITTQQLLKEFILIRKNIA